MPTAMNSKNGLESTSAPATPLLFFGPVHPVSGAAQPWAAMPAVANVISFLKCRENSTQRKPVVLNMPRGVFNVGGSVMAGIEQQLRHVMTGPVELNRTCLRVVAVGHRFVRLVDVRMVHNRGVIVDEVDTIAQSRRFMAQA